MWLWSVRRCWMEVWLSAVRNTEWNVAVECPVVLDGNAAVSRLVPALRLRPG